MDSKDGFYLIAKTAIDYIKARHKDSRTIEFNFVIFFIAIILGGIATFTMSEYPTITGIVLVVAKLAENSFSLWLYGDTIKKSQDGDYDYISRYKEIK